MPNQVGQSLLFTTFGGELGRVVFLISHVRCQLLDFMHFLKDIFFFFDFGLDQWYSRLQSVDVDLVAILLENHKYSSFVSYLNYIKP